jgi:hypothetical protein
MCSIIQAVYSQATFELLGIQSQADHIMIDQIHESGELSGHYPVPQENLGYAGQSFNWKDQQLAIDTKIPDYYQSRSLEDGLVTYYKSNKQEEVSGGGCPLCFNAIRDEFLQGTKITFQPNAHHLNLSEDYSEAVNAYKSPGVDHQEVEKYVYQINEPMAAKVIQNGKYYAYYGLFQYQPKQIKGFSDLYILKIPVKTGLKKWQGCDWK